MFNASELIWPPAGVGPVLASVGQSQCWSFGFLLAFFWFSFGFLSVVLSVLAPGLAGVGPALVCSFGVPLVSICLPLVFFWVLYGFPLEAVLA